MTGAHRSGTTWTGRMLAAHPGVCYIQEPFNKQQSRLGRFGRRVDYWYQFPDERFQAAFERALGFDYSLAAEIPTLRSPKDAGRMLRDWVIFRQCRRSGARPLIKDPLALMAAEWLAERFGCRVIVLVRHPAAFTYSLRKQGWGFDFRNFLQQPALMEAYLNPLRTEIERAAASIDPVHRIATLWKALYSVVLGYQQRHPDWLIVRHEDLAAEPLTAFAPLFEYAGLDYHEACKRAIREHSAAGNRVEAQAPNTIQRDSRGLVGYWRAHLTEAEIAAIWGITRNVAHHFYPEPG